MLDQPIRYYNSSAETRGWLGNVQGKGVSRHSSILQYSSKPSCTGQPTHRSSHQTASRYATEPTYVPVIVGGAFSGLERIIESRIGKGGLGFGANLRSIGERSLDDVVRPGHAGRHAQVRADPGVHRPAPGDHQRAQPRPGRAGRILTEPRNALVRQYQRLFELDGVELEFSPDALEAIADQANLRGTGARGLRAIMEEVLLSVMYEVPSNPNAARVEITREVVLDNVDPTIVPRDFGGRRARREREEKSA